MFCTDKFIHVGIEIVLCRKKNRAQRNESFATTEREAQAFASSLVAVAQVFAHLQLTLFFGI